MEETMTLTPEQIAEMEARKNQELFGDKVQKIGGCAVVTVEDEVVSLEMPITYPQLVNAIIGKKYDDGQEKAIKSNFLASLNGSESEEKAAEHKAEFEAYQSWRETAKTVAKEVMGVNA